MVLPQLVFQELVHVVLLVHESAVVLPQLVFQELVQVVLLVHESAVVLPQLVFQELLNLHESAAVLLVLPLT